MKKVIVVLLASLLFCSKGWALYDYGDPVHNTAHITSGVLCSALAFFSFRAGAQNHGRTRDFFNVAGGVFCFNAVYRFGGGD